MILGLELACPKKAGIVNCPLWQAGPQKLWITSVATYVRSHGLDGVEVDFEAFNVGDADDLKARRVLFSVRDAPLFQSISV